MTIDKLSTTITPLYVQDERPDSGTQERALQQDTLQSSLARRDQSRALLDRRARADRDNAVVTLSSRQADVPRTRPAVAPAAYRTTNALPVYSSDPFFARVQSAYALLDQNEYKGLYVDKRV